MNRQAKTAAASGWIFRIIAISVVSMTITIININNHYSSPFSVSQICFEFITCIWFCLLVDLAQHRGLGEGQPLQRLELGQQPH